MRLNFPRIENNHSFSRKVSMFVQVSFMFTDVYSSCILVLQNNILKFADITSLDGANTRPQYVTVMAKYNEKALQNLHGKLTFRPE